MTTPETPASLRDELSSLDSQIAELQRGVDELRSEDSDPADRAVAIGQTEQQETLISELDTRRRELIDKIDAAS